MEDLLKTIKLSRSAHKSPDEGTCLMEAASIIAGEKFSWIPECVDNSIISVGVLVNDFIDASKRNDVLIPFLYRIVGTRNEDFVKVRLEMLEKFIMKHDLDTCVLGRGIKYICPRNVCKSKIDKFLEEGIQLLDDMIKLTEIKEKSPELEKSMV